MKYDYENINSDDYLLMLNLLLVSSILTFDLNARSVQDTATKQIRQ